MHQARTIICFLVSMMLFQLLSVPAYAFQQPKLNQSKADHIFPHTLSGSTYNELWTYQFFLEDNIEITIVFSVAAFGSLKAPVSGARLSVVGLGPKTYQVLREYPIERLVLNRETHTVRLHQNRELYFEGKLPETHFVKFTTTKDDIRYDIQLRLSDIHPGYMYGDGTFRLDGSTIGMITHIPYAKVEGFVSVDGIEKNVRGTAYMDHSFQDKLVTKLLSDGYRYVFHGDRYNWEVGQFISSNSQDDTNVVGYSLQKTDGKSFIKLPERLHRTNFQSIDGHSIPRTVRIEFEGGASTTLNRQSYREKFPLFQELGRFARRAAKTFMGGEVVEFRGKADLYRSSQGTDDSFFYFFLID
jgi:hypothetical protein